MAGSGPMRSPASRRAIAAISSSLSSKSKTSTFSRIRSGVTDFGITTLPSCRCQRRIVWAGVLPWWAAIVAIVVVVEQRALGERAPGLGGDRRARRARRAARPAAAAGAARSGSPSAAARPRRFSRSRSSTRKLETPIERDAALLPDPFEGAPGVEVAVLARHRPVDQVEVDVVEAEPLEALLEGAQRRVVALLGVPELGGDEDLVAVAARRRRSPPRRPPRCGRRRRCRCGGSRSPAPLRPPPGCPPAAPGRRRSRAGGSPRRRAGRRRGSTSRRSCRCSVPIGSRNRRVPAATRRLCSRLGASWWRARPRAAGRRTSRRGRRPSRRRLPRLAVRERAPATTPTRKMKAAIPRPIQKTGGIAAATLSKPRPTGRFPSI